MASAARAGSRTAGRERAGGMEAILSSKVIADGDATIASGRNDGNARAEDGAAPFSYWRSTLRFLISAIAFAGFSPFGQVLVQLMMVCDRKSTHMNSSH